jgi:hypothetical protein
MADYRPVPDDRRADFRAIARYAFDAQSGPHHPEEDLDERRERMYAFGEERGMFEGEDLQVVCSHIPFTVRVRDTWLPLGGVTAVASPPANRRQGLVGEMMAESLVEYRDREWLLSGLHPFDEAFYSRYGWETGCLHHRATVDVDALERGDVPDNCRRRDRERQYVGYHTVPRARRFGELDAEREGAAEMLAALFPECDPFMPEGF